MRNMIQLLGGAAVAGVVAAGSTAFTGFGAYSSIAAANVPHLGGTFTQAVTGAATDASTFTGYVTKVSTLTITVS